MARLTGGIPAKHTRDQKRELVLRAFEQRPELTFTKLKQLTGLTTSPLSRTLEWMERGRPRHRPDSVLGDRGYDAEAIRQGLRACAYRGMISVNVHSIRSTSSRITRIAC